MKKTNIVAKAGFLLIAAGLVLGGCKKKEDEETMTPQVVVEPNKTTYPLRTVDALGVSGTVTFTEKSTTETIIDIVLTNVKSGTHPAHIHANSALETGGIALSLNPVDSTGKSSTIVTKLDNGTAINYTQLTSYDGYLNVHESGGLLGPSATLYAQGDIGGNILTGDKKSYNLASLGTFNVAGTFTLEKRKNGNSLATIALTGTINGNKYPAHIHIGSITTNGPIAISLSDVDGASGLSLTNIRKLDAGTAITYDQLLGYTGYVNVHKSASELDVIISQGNIGSNPN